MFDAGRHWKRACGGLALSLAGCTFGAIADYEVTDCLAAMADHGRAWSRSDDPCERLNEDQGTACQRYQCVAQADGTGSCALVSRDVDHDGDPDPACGGHDCDDADGARSSLFVDACDAIDNDCSGVADDGLLALSQRSTGKLANSPLDATFSRGGGGHVLLSYASTNSTTPGTAPCMAVVDEDGQQVGNGTCTFSLPAKSTGFHHPNSVAVGTDTASAYVVTTSDCASLPGLSTTRATAGLLSTPDECGASLPAVVPFGTGSRALVGFYGAPYSARDLGKVETQCASLDPAPLRVHWISDVITATPSFSADQTTLSQETRSFAPPALVAIPESSFVLVASPASLPESPDSVGLWVTTGEGSLSLLSRIPDLKEAHSAALAVGTINPSTHLAPIAIVATLGCPPSQTLAIATGTIDVSVPSVDTFEVDRDVLSGVRVQSAPSIGWMTERREWVVSWTDRDDSGVVARALTLGAHGEHPEPPFTLGKADRTVVQGDDAQGGSVKFLLLAGTNLSQVALTCR